MSVYAKSAAGVPIYDDTGDHLFVEAGTGNIIERNGNRVHVDGDGNPLDGVGGALVGQPDMVIRIEFLRILTLAAAGGPAAPAATAVIARNPARVDDQPINYSSKEGSILYQQGIKSLYIDTAERFALKGDLAGLIDNVTRRGKACGWKAIFEVPDLTTAATIRNLMTSHGTIKLEEIKAHVETYSTIGGPVVRPAQDDEMLFQCLMASISKEAQDVVTLRVDEYTVNDEFSGTLLLKIILMESQVDTKSTMMLLHQKLSAGLPDLMAECGSNVKSFNQKVRIIQRKLASRGAASGDLLPQLLFAYNQCDKKDGKFSRYIEQLENAFSDETVTLTAATLMTKAENKYSELIEKGDFSGATKKETDSIVALQTEITNLKSAVGKFSGKYKGNPGGEGDPAFKQLSGDKIWIVTPPKDNEPKKKVVNGKDYHWCQGHDHHAPKWVRHDPASCEGLLKGNKPTPEADTKTEVPVAEKKVKWATAMMSAMVGKGEDEDE